MGLALLTALGLVGLASPPAQAADSDAATIGELQAAAGCSAPASNPDTITLTADISAPADQVVVTCHVVLDLAGHDLAVRNIVIDSGQSLTIDDSGTAGTLTADASGTVDGQAGIQNTAATLTINAGTIAAISGPERRYANTGAGIGGSGHSSGIGAPGGTTIINGGTVTADGGNGSAGIGGSANAAGGTTTINGGTVTALGGKYGAGIGGGDHAVGGTTTIKGGTVVATGSDSGSGIGGGGYGGAGGTTLITGGTVTATGDFGGAGIGGGVDGKGGTTTIDGGTVIAVGHTGGAGIGGGTAQSGGLTTIHDGTVSATGNDGGAGIGGGASADGGTTVIDGGSVTATGSTDAAGIGGGGNRFGGPGGAGGTTSIERGAVVATGGHTAVGGGGNSTSFGTLKVSGGVLRVPTGAFVIPDSAGPEVTIGALGVIDGSTGSSPTYATISGNGDIDNGGAIRLPTANVTGVTVRDHHYLVGFNTHGGSAAPGPVTVYADSFTSGGRPFPAAPTRAGYVFAGWNSAADGGGVPITATGALPGASSGTPVMITAHAQWRLPVSSVTLPEPTVTGAPRVGERLRAGVGATNPPTAGLSYQWLRHVPGGGVTAIPGATGSSYVLRVADLGARISVRVTATASGYDPATATSAPTSDRIRPGRMALPKPVIKGKPSKGNRLRVRLDAPDLDGLTLRYKWRAGGVLLDSRSASLRLGRMTVGKRIRVIVTATAPGYEPVTVRSQRTRRVAPGA